MINGSALDSAPATAAPPGPRPIRSLDLDAWSEARIPLLRDPRALVAELFRIHAPTTPGTAVLAVLDAEGRLVGGGSFVPRAGAEDGWLLRNALLAHLRRIVPDGLRRPHPAHTCALMLCRHGESGWTAEDGPWMWALRDSCALHGLRCGAYLTLTEQGWRVLGEERSGRTPHLGTRPQDAVRTVRALPEPELRPGRTGESAAATTDGAEQLVHRAVAR